MEVMLKMLRLGVKILGLMAAMQSFPRPTLADSLPFLAFWINLYQITVKEAHKKIFNLFNNNKRFKLSFLFNKC